MTLTPQTTRNGDQPPVPDQTNNSESKTTLFGVNHVDDRPPKDSRPSR